MGKDYSSISDEHREWIAEQSMFFVATAPLAADGHVNLSPKGFDTFRILDANRVAYLDLTGSGAETIAHLRENGRVTIMFMALSGRPRILRLYGTGTAHLHGTDRFDELAAGFAPHQVARSVIDVSVERVRSSCGYTVPLLEPVGMRDTYDNWADRRGPTIDEYWATRNSTSIDGLPAIDSENPA
ncbi:MAG: pyridoxamine 5'-phosphate oxidase family protein [Actinobacteria bacterium]|nr:pyridoxamine 5'-phosphate oxidase family protein [Actinomycetota bacterium]